MKQQKDAFSHDPCPAGVLAGVAAAIVSAIAACTPSGSTGGPDGDANDLSLEPDDGSAAEDTAAVEDAAIFDDGAGAERDQRLLRVRHDLDAEPGRVGIDRLAVPGPCAARGTLGILS
jgi:hypothetical protein